MSELNEVEFSQLVSDRSGWKFRCANDFSLAILTNREVWFASVETLNDPFDSTADVRAIFESARQKIIDSGEEIISCTDSPGLYVYASIDDSKKYLIFSLCGGVNNTLMWSHYAQEYRGLAFGFDFEHDENIQRHQFIQTDYDKTIEEVFEKAIRDHQNYRKDPSNLKLKQSHEFNKNIMLKVQCSIKSKEWDYEKERRVVCRVDASVLDGRTVQYSPASLKYVVFGLRCDDYFVSTVTNILEEPAFQHVEMFTTSIDLNSKKLMFNKKVKMTKVKMQDEIDEGSISL